MMGSDPGTSVPPRLSIVVGCRRVEVDPTHALRSLQSQQQDGVELIAVDDARPDAPPWSVSGWLTLRRPGALVPEMWAAGIEVAQGDIVALTTASVVPEPDWVDRLLAVPPDGPAAIGGAIEPSRALSWVDWAVYFCRYTPYMLPFGDGEGLELPGDNAAYRREVLDRYRHLYREGFWEPFVHAALRRDGWRLEMHPELVVRQAPGISLRGFSRQRFLHGRRHGRQRSAGLGKGRVLLEGLTAPLVPFLLIARSAGNVWRKRRYRARLLVVAPVLLWFYGWWAAGELAGRVDVVRGKG